MPEELQERIRGFSGQAAHHQLGHRHAFEAIEEQGYDVKSFLTWYKRLAYDVIEPRVDPVSRLATTAALEPKSIRRKSDASRRRSCQWPKTADGQIALTTRRLDLQALLQHPPTDHRDRFPPGTDVGHIHLEGTEIAGAESFYAQLLHLNVTVQARNVLFTAKDDYHHHIGLNGWNRRSRPLNEESLGLVSIEASLPHLANDQLLADARSAGVSVTKREDAVVLRDLNNIPWICRTA